MRKLKITKPLNDSHETGGYMARTISRGLLQTAPIISWTHFYHKPYACDWKEAKEKAMDRVLSQALQEGV